MERLAERSYTWPIASWSINRASSLLRGLDADRRNRKPEHRLAPVRAAVRRVVSDLRAIPWVFAWTQNRCLFRPGTDWARCCGHSAARCREPGNWSVSSTAVAFLSGGDRQRRFGAGEKRHVHRPALRGIGRFDRGEPAIWQLISEEYARSRQAVIDIVGGDDLLSNTRWFQNSIEARNPYIDPLNLIRSIGSNGGWNWQKRRPNRCTNAPTCCGLPCRESPPACGRLE